MKTVDGAFSLEGITEDVKKTITLQSRFSSKVISPMAAFFGGIAA